MRRIARVALVLSLVPAALVTAGPARAVVDPEEGDFNGDGYADLAVGVAFENVGTKRDGGAVNVIYGGASGLSSAGAQLWTLDSPGVPGGAAEGDFFGYSVATGDFDADGYGDLAVGAPTDRVSREAGAGSVLVLYGSGDGLGADGGQLITQASPGVPDRPEWGDLFGFSLAVGDFDGDGVSDLAVGSIREETSGRDDAGAVTVLFGATGIGLSGAGAQLLVRGEGGLVDRSDAGDLMGFSLASGDFDGDTYDDLAVGVPHDDYYSRDSGSVVVIYGSAEGLDPGRDFLYRAFRRTATQFFGWDLAAGSFVGDGYDGLVVASPGTPVNGVKKAGEVVLIYGGASGLGSRWALAEDHADIPTEPKEGEFFGSALAIGDFDGDTVADIAATANERIDGHPYAGAAFVIPGAVGDPDVASTSMWSQDSPGALGSAQDFDLFGWEMVAADFDGSGQDDLAVAVALEDLSGSEDGGIVHAFYGSGTGITATGNQLWSQDSPGIPDRVERNDQFGWVVA